MTHYQLPTILPKSIFRAYDIRGIVNETITTDIVYAVGLAVGTEAKAIGDHTVIVGRDGRLSGPSLQQAIIAGLLASGCDVVNIGAIPSPVLYFATHHLKSRSGVMVTGSHNPPDYNGLKLVIGGETYLGDAIQNLYKRIESRRFSDGQGEETHADIVDQYIQRIVKDIELTRPMKVVVDCGNGIPGMLVPRLMRELGCEVTELYCDVDGKFPNHHPDPTILENLQDLIAAVKAQQADIGLAFDGDGDRLGIVTDQGEIIWPDRQMMLIAKDILRRNPGEQIIFDVKCTRHLADVISQYGGKPVMWKTGHSMIKAKLQETGGLFAGEMSGHIFFKERWYGFDDAMYTAARILEIVSRDERTVSRIFRDFPNGVNTPELKVPIDEEKKFNFMQQFVKAAKFPSGDINTIDGIRVDFPYGWGLVRSSNTTPCLTVRFEADDKKQLNHIQSLFRQQLLSVDNTLELPF